MGGDVDGVVRVVALFLHQRNHHRTHRRHIGQWRAGDATKQRAADDVAHPQATAYVAHQAIGKTHDALGNTAIEHQLARENEKRNRKKGEHLHAANHLLEHHRNRQASGNDGGDRRQANRKRHRHTQHQKEGECQP